MKTHNTPRATGNAAHTPTPWRYTIDLSLADEASAIVTAPDGSTVAIVVANGDAALSAAANAAFIVRACNSHDALVEALAETTEALKEARRYLSLGDRDAMRAYTETGEVQTKARAAIAKAEGRE